MQYKVIKEYTDTPEQPIVVTQGEQLTVIEESDSQGDWPNWVLCRGEGKEGWAPKQQLTIVANSATVQSDYCAVEHRLSVGEILVAEFELNGWIWCDKSSNKGVMGWAPLNHLALVGGGHSFQR
ncbi:SH3 domain-containing protein [uncultured Vibrio sp.]|uniref:SH3 domain-containing protein n=1 Tax=uncultured Vibrio sp. TaxID=114054 RepID=UPI00261B8AE0|nr:SH3 domain-containing protein [uncultured Vibrio sp.]